MEQKHGRLRLFDFIRKKLGKTSSVGDQPRKNPLGVWGTRSLEEGTGWALAMLTSRAGVKITKVPATLVREGKKASALIVLGTR